ncbi:right-handed parallel beta-helix repeat-containing protein [Bartonella schoenbuchensis]|uniref:right-handed parallel beta-helix repeat-containing protein n=1 Tax=Bartonella schoenbuchensis TaxID=165694 RepID=UPI003144D506
MSVGGGTVMMNGGEIRGSGNVTVKGVNVSKVGMGIMMEGSGTLTVSGGSIGFTGAYGVMVEKGVTSATLTGVMITGSGNNGTGIYAMGGNLTVKEGTTITGVEEGIKMEGVMIMGSGSEGKGTGVWLSDSKTVMLGQVEISGVEMGINMSGGTVWLAGTTYSLYLFMFSCMFFCIVCECVVYFFLF